MSCARMLRPGSRGGGGVLEEQPCRGCHGDGIAQPVTQRVQFPVITAVISFKFEQEKCFLFKDAV